MNRAIWQRLTGTEYGVSLALCIFLLGMLMAVVNPILPVVLSNTIGLDKSGIAAFFLLITLTAMAITLGSGYLSDGIVARHKLVLVGGIIGALSYLGIGAATLPIHAFAAGPFMIGVSLMFPQLFAVARAGMLATWEHEVQVMGITALRTLFSFGYVFGTALSGGLAATIDMQAIFFLLAGGSLALTVFASRVIYQLDARIVREVIPPIRDEAAVLAPKPRITLPYYTLAVPLLALLILQGADSTRHVYLPLIMFQMFGDASIAPLMFGITAAFELITMGLLGYLSSRSDERIVIAGAAMFGSLYFMVMSLTQALPLMYLVQAMHAIFVAAMVGVAMAYVQGLLSHRAGLGGSLYMVVMNSGTLVGILAPLLVTGYDQKIFIIPAVLCVVGAILLMTGASTARIEKRLQPAVVPAAVSPD